MSRVFSADGAKVEDCAVLEDTPQRTERKGDAVTTPTTRVKAPVPQLQGRVADWVTSHLRALILSGDLPAGEPLRVEHLAADLGVSMTPIRESLFELHTEGFVDREPRRGFTVARLTRRGFDDQVLVLAFVTGELAARAAALLDQSAVARLERLQDDLEQRVAAGDVVGAAHVNYDFHRSINIAADSDRLASLAQLHSHYVPLATLLALPSKPAQCTYEHADLIQALAAGEAEGARRAMTDHMKRSGAALARHLEREGLWSSMSAR